MSLLPELIFQTTISRGIITLRNDSRLIDQLFRNLSQGDLSQIRDFLKSQTINLVINFPRSTLSLPAIVIVLKNENESATYLNDSMGMDVPDTFGYEGAEDFPEVLGGVASTSSMYGPGKVVFGPHKVLSATNNTIKVSDNQFVRDCFVSNSSIKGHTVHIVAGKGKGQIRDIVANSHNIIMVDPNWSTIPDTTSIFEVREEPYEVVGEPSRLYDRRNDDLNLERKGAMYTNRYQIQLVGSNPQQTIYLYAILKSIFTLSRTFLEEQGIVNMKLSGTDFTNRPEYLPDFSYMRALNVEFEHPFDVYSELKGAAKKFKLILHEAMEDAEVSNTTLDITPKTPTVEGP